MHFDLRQTSRVAMVFVLAATFVLPQNLVAEAATHVVSPSETSGGGGKGLYGKAAKPGSSSAVLLGGEGAESAEICAYEPGAGKERRLHTRRCRIGAAGFAGAEGTGQFRRRHAERS